MIDPVRNRLPQIQAARQVLQAFTDVRMHRLLVAPARLQTQFQFRHMHAFGMLIQLGASGTTPDLGDLRHRTQQQFGLGGHLHRFSQRHPGIEA